MHAQDSHNGMLVVGVSAVLGIVGLLLLFSQVQSTAQVIYSGDKVYSSGVLEAQEFPYLEGRRMGGVQTTPEGVRVATEVEAFEQGVPYRTFSRVLSRIPTLQTSCGEGFISTTLDGKRVYESEVRVTRGSATTEFKCMDRVESLGAYCCPVPVFTNRE